MQIQNVSGRITTDATPVDNYLFRIENNQCAHMELRVIACTSALATRKWVFFQTWKNLGGVLTTTSNVNVSKLVDDVELALTTASLTMVAGVNGAVNVRIVGVAGTTIKWVTEVQYLVISAP